jgi:hypothetical protein
MLDGTVLDRVSSVNDLGIIIDEKITFSEHVHVMVAKAFAMLAFIRRLSLEFRDPYILKSLYTSLVRPILEFMQVAYVTRSMMFVLTEWNAHWEFFPV